MLITIRDTYRGYVLNRVLEPGEHEVPDSIGEYLIENFQGPPFFVRRVEKSPPIETKPAMNLETKPRLPEQTKADPVLKPRPIPRPKVKP